MKSLRVKKEEDMRKAIEVEHRLTEQEQRIKSNTHRLDKLEPIVNEIHTMTKTMVQLVEEVKHTNETVGLLDEKVEHIDGRVDAMERAPVDDIKAYRRTAVTTIIGTVVGAFATGLVWLISNCI